MKLVGKILIILALSFFAIQMVVLAADKGVFSTSPKLNHGKKWRVGYYEGGPYIAYPQFLAEAVKGLMKLGWIETAQLPPLKGEASTDLWNWLATQAKSNYIKFVKDFHYTANWEDKLREEQSAKIIKRLNMKNDIDLIIAMGTWAGQDLANNKHKIPTLVMSASDPLGAGIVKSVEDSGYDHVLARVDPNRYERQLRIFHDMIGFQKLGVVYEDTVAGRSYSAMDKVEKVSKERGFEIVRCHALSDIPDVEKREKAYIECFRQVAQKADAIYVTAHSGASVKTFPELVKIAHTYRVPTFSQVGSDEVRWGLLASLSQAGYKYVGMYNAKVMAKAFNGAKLRQLDQVFEAPPKIALNLKTAVTIGYDPPVDVLGAADEVFEDIEAPPNE